MINEHKLRDFHTQRRSQEISQNNFDGQRIDLIDDKMTPTAFIPAYKEVDI